MFEQSALNRMSGIEGAEPAARGCGSVAMRVGARGGGRGFCGWRRGLM